MTPISTTAITFSTPVGIVVIEQHESGWFYEFTSGYMNGLHNPHPMKDFDKCYRHVTANLKTWIKDMNSEYEATN